MRLIQLPTGLDELEINQRLPRAEFSVETVSELVGTLLSEVKDFGLAGIQSQALRLDNVEGLRPSVTPAEIAAATVSPELMEAIRESILRVRRVAEQTMVANSHIQLGEGAEVSLRQVPVDSVGVYVPGGKAVYPSSVIMNVVPAQVAGVKRIALATPPQSDGRPHPAILAAAHELGITEIYAIGGAGAVAAFAYGVPEISLEPVRMVTGPGNVYVATAKRLLRGLIGIDSEAGPTEILILADETANPRYIAADLISQAEHDENAAAILISDSDKLLFEVEKEVELQLQSTVNRGRATIALSGIQSALVKVDSWAEAIRVTNAYATEHLEIISRDPESDLNQISNAGAVFLGEHSPVSLGDYLAGSNHVLPTGQQAKFGPGLGVHTFLRPQQVIKYNGVGLQAVADRLSAFALAEGLPAHGQAAKIRFEE